MFEDGDDDDLYCTCDICDIWGQGACLDDDPDFDEGEI